MPPPVVELQPSAIPVPVPIPSGVATPTPSPKRAQAQWRLYAWIAYNVALYAVIVVSGAILFMVMVGMVTVGGGNSDVKDEWIEVNSQILNGVFTWMAVTNHPFFIYRLTLALRVVGVKRLHWSCALELRVRAARALSRQFPLVFVDTSVVRESKLERADANVDAHEDDLYVELATETVETDQLGEIVYVHEDAEYLRNTFVMLNWNCLFQYPITAVMWAYDADSRPGFVIAAFLPLSFLCNFGGQYRLFLLNKRAKQRRPAVPAMTQDDAVPATAELTTSNVAAPQL